MERPTGVSILAVLCFIGAVFYVLAALVLLVGGAALSHVSGMKASMGALLAGLGALGGVIVLGFAVLQVAVGYGLWRLLNWARIVLIVFIALGLLSAAAGVFASMIHFNVAALLGH